MGSEMCIRDRLLVQHMYDEGLIDRHEFLSWLIELLEKMRAADDTVLKLILGQALRVSCILLLLLSAIFVGPFLYAGHHCFHMLNEQMYWSSYRWAIHLCWPLASPS